MNYNSYINWESYSDKNLLKQFGDYVRHQRLNLNKTQEQVAKDANISRSTLSLLERGETVTTSTLIQVLRVLNSLSVMNAFQVQKELSPIAVAKLQEKERKRASGNNSNTVNEPEIDWEMVNTAIIKLWGEKAAVILWDNNRRVGSFQYTPHFLSKNIDLAPLVMPIQSGTKVYSFPEFSSNETFKGLPGLIADVLPDKYGNHLINSWLIKNNRPTDSMNPIEQLCFIGKRGMGALEFEPDKMPETAQNFSLELDSLIDIARKVLNERKKFNTNIKEDEEKALKDILKIGTSAGGARPKAIITFNATTGEVKSGQADVEEGFEHWLLKLDGVSDTQFGASEGYGRVEMAYYNMTKDCGINMMESRLLEENGRAHFMTKRFDRSGSKKHHVQTFCAMRHFDFNEVGSFSYEQLFETMRMLRLTYPEAEEMYRRMAFNVIARNCDDHTKTFRFLCKKIQTGELAPAYDVCYAYRPGSIWVSQHSLSINGKRNHHTKDDLLTLAKNINVKKADRIIDSIHEVVREWKFYANKYNVDDKKMNVIAENLIFL